MPTMKFNCPHCVKSIEVGDDCIGMIITCPVCNGRISIAEPASSECDGKKEIPRSSGSRIAAQPESSLPPPLLPGGKRCPYCAEIIQKDSVVCRFCRFDLHTGKPIPIQPSPQNTASRPNVVQARSRGIFSRLLKLPTVSPLVWCYCS